MLTINNLTVQYGRHIVLNELNLTLEQGQVHGLIGLNGSGKTTLLNTMYGLVKSTKGEIVYNGTPLRKTKIAFLQTENFFYSTITGREYLNFFRYYNPSFNVDSLLNLFQLPLHELVDSYSTGMKKKLAILSTLILDKELMIFDEPFNGIDIESMYVLTHLIGKLKDKGKTVILTSHIIDTLIPLCDKIHYLQDGKISQSFDSVEFPHLISLLEDCLREKYKNMES
ncbi:MAG: ATP-binding cassette domain-containing protein [Tannerellaceae bacterium]|jgi:ABC-2 type transport system ATP-binding protein|nr:ATP-binding cassette domain-containing protein [Tannerellaceae bacterium]